VRLKRNYLTYGEKIKLQELYLKKAKVNIDTQKIAEFDPTVVFEANKTAFNFLVVEIETPEKEIIKTNLYDYVMNLKEEDGQAIFNEINKYTAPQPADLEKKIY
jgi:hypothetical protein